MQNLTRRTFAKLSAIAAATSISPVFLGASLGAEPHPSVADQPSSSHRSEDDKLQSEFLLDLTLEAQAPHRAADRLIVPVSGGTFEGQRLKGTIISPSATGSFNDLTVLVSSMSASCYRPMTTRRSTCPGAGLPMLLQAPDSLPGSCPSSKLTRPNTPG